ncbi:hypothetical protein BSYN_03900 [Bacteroides sedimenti]|uniref:Uncharacterized protein n=1 Tax=Bacteroides sedimenti TaxID=2136147 RepID=A0ABN6Z7N4_9BACE
MIGFILILAVIGIAVAWAIQEDRIESDIARILDGKEIIMAKAHTLEDLECQLQRVMRSDTYSITRTTTPSVMRNGAVRDRFKVLYFRGSYYVITTKSST